VAHKVKGLGAREERERERERDGSRGFVERHRHSGCSAHGLQLSGAGRRGESGVQLCGALGVVFGEGGKQTAEKKKKNRTIKVL
jgi:hypothetical protein